MPVCSGLADASEKSAGLPGFTGGVGRWVGVAGFDLAGSLEGMMERIADGRGAA